MHSSLTSCLVSCLISCSGVKGKRCRSGMPGVLGNNADGAGVLAVGKGTTGVDKPGKGFLIGPGSPEDVDGARPSGVDVATLRFDIDTAPDPSANKSLAGVIGAGLPVLLAGAELRWRVKRSTKST